jgi:RND family efflux transporter MFP subunit
MRSLARSFAPRFTVAFALAAVAVAGVAGCRKPDDASAATPPREAAAPLHVTTVAVVQRPMPELLTLTGTLHANESSEVAANVAGKVVATYVERGQSVKKGMVIARVDARSAALAASAAEAQSKVAQSQLEEARRDCARVQHLLDTGAISQAEYDRQTSQCTSQQWSAAAAQAQQQSASKLLGDADIRAPFDGVIGERYVNVGQYVQAATRVASVYAPDPLRLELTVPEENVAVIQQDMPVHFTVTAFGDQTFTGNVKYISPNIRESSRDLVVEAVVPNAEMKLRPGMFAVARIGLGDKPHAVVPRNAILTDDTGSRVYVVQQSQVQERLVQLGETVGDQVAVIDGVKAGENVIVSPGSDVRDGARVD